MAALRSLLVPHINESSRREANNDAIPLRSLIRSHTPASTTERSVQVPFNQPAYQSSTTQSSSAGTVEGGVQGWTVVAGSSVIFFVTLGLIYSFGVLQAELLRRRYASASTLGWVSSTTVVILPLFALPITSLIRNTSNRTVGLIGALCTGSGYIATSYTFSTSVVYVFLAQTLFGIGYALNFWSCNSLAGEYFTRKRALAVGIVYAGSGLGGAAFSIGLSRLITQVGLEWGVRIIGIISLVTLLPASMTLRKKGNAPIPKFNLALFKQINFNLLLFSTGFMTFSLFVPAFYLPSYAATAGMSIQTGTYLVAGYNLASFVGRILFGLLADSRVGPLTSLCLAMILMALSILSIWIASNGILAPLIIFLLINGAASGALLSLQPPALASMYGVDEMASTMAVVTMSRAAGSAFGAPIAGILLDAFGGPHSSVKAYTYPLLVMGMISLMAATALLILRYRLGGLDLKKKI